MASQYECEHVKQAKAPANCDPVAVYQPTLSNYPCSESVKDKLREVVASLPGDTPPVVQVSEQSFAVFGLPTASNQPTISAKHQTSINKKMAPYTKPTTTTANF